MDFEVGSSPELFVDGSLAHAIDAYKFTVAYFSETQILPNSTFFEGNMPKVVFSLSNRNLDLPLSNYISSAEVAEIVEGVTAGNIFSEADLSFLENQSNATGGKLYESELVREIGNRHTGLDYALAEVEGQLQVLLSGGWSEVTLMETLLLSQIAEAYYTRKLAEMGISEQRAWQQAEQTLVENLKTYRELPRFKVVEFGTRRRLSRSWHRRALEIIGNELYPGQLIGTSNIAFAREFNLALVGTYPHEVPMIWAASARAKGLPNYLSATLQEFHAEWFRTFGPKLAIGLTDVFTSELFDKAWTPELALSYRGYREDSAANPIEWLTKRVAMLRRLGLNNSDIAQKIFLFSNGITPTLASRILSEPVAKDVDVVFGIGGNLVGNLNGIIEPLNIVMKPVLVSGLPTVKLSDAPGKTQGTHAQI